MVVGEFHIFHGNSPEIKRGSAEHPPFSSIFFPATNTSISFADFPASHG
jgi:hypothetical protein